MVQVPVGEVVYDTLGHASIRVTMEVYGHLLTPARMHAAEAMRQAPMDRRVARLRPIGYKTGYKPDRGCRRQRSELGCGGPPGSRSRHLGIKSPLLFRMS
jgi:hypothetical protein